MRPLREILFFVPTKVEIAAADCNTYFVSLAYRLGNYASDTRFVSVLLRSSCSDLKSRTNLRLRYKNSPQDCF